MIVQQRPVIQPKHTEEGRGDLLIRVATKEDIPAITELINSVFRLNRNTSWFNHLHFKNPFGSSSICLAQAADGRVVSYRSILASRVSVDGITYMCGQLADACTHPDFRGQGLYGKVHRMAMQEFQALGGSFIYAFPSPTNYQILMGRFNGIDLSSCMQLLYPLKLSSQPRLIALGTMMHRVFFGRQKGKSVVHIAPGFPLTKLSRRAGAVHVVYSREELEWRLNMPGREYYSVVLDENNYLLIGTANRRGMELCTILDREFTDMRNFKLMFASLRQWAYESGFHAIFTWDHGQIHQLLRLGFIPLFRKTPLVIVFPGIRPTDLPLVKNAWDMRLIDTDAY